MTRLPGIPVLVFALTVTAVLYVAVEASWIWHGFQAVWIVVVSVQWARGRYGHDKSLRDFFS